MDGGDFLGSFEYSQITFPIFGDGFAINPPRSFSVFGFSIYFYGIFIMLGFLLALIYMLRRRQEFDLTSDNIFDMILLAIPGGIIGSRIYYVIFNPADFFGAGGRFVNVFNIRHGGLAIYGGIIGAVILFIIYCRIKKVSFFKIADIAVFGVFIGQIVGRWGNFLNREAYGVLTDVPWRMGLTSVFPQRINESVYEYITFYVHPTFFYEALWNTIGFLLLHFYSKKRKPKYHGQFLLFYVAWYGLGRFVIEGLRADSLFVGSTNIRVSQLLAALSFCVAVTLLVVNKIRGVQAIEQDVAAADDEPAAESDTDD